MSGHKHQNHIPAQHYDLTHKLSSVQCDQTLHIFITALKMCVYLMSRVVLHMDLEDGVNITVQELLQCILQKEEVGLPRVAATVFTLWMCSDLLGNTLITLDSHYKHDA